MASTSRGGFVSSLTDSLDFNQFIRQNLSNPEFMAFGRENGMEDVEQLWREVRTRAELEDVHETSIEDAISTVRDSVSNSTLDGWFRNADSSYKPKLVDSILSNPGTLNAGLNIAYHNYKFAQMENDQPAQSFNNWLKTPQTMYRGTTGKAQVASDIFTSYTPNRSVAAKFANYTGGSISSMKIRPIDTWGSYQTTSEQEFLIPVRR